jgi:hypothetical protein
MKFTLQIVAGEGTDAVVHELAILDKHCERLEHIGLTLDESKQVLRELQRQVVEHQAAAFVHSRAFCEHCGSKRRGKGRHSLVFRTLFGNITLDSPRLRHCACTAREAQSFSPLAELLPERSAPELRFMETKWASLVSYGMTAKALRDFLPIDEATNASTVRNHTLAVAQRTEATLGEERVFFADGCPNDWNALPPAEGPITVGIDGGYLRHWTQKKKNFEVIVGKSVPAERPAKCFGMVQVYDEKPKRRLFDVLSSQGMQMNQDVVFMSDGEKTVRELQLYLNPRAKHMLDWFHITMRITVLGQFLKGLRHAKLEEEAAPLTVTGLVDEMERALEHTKWNLWHGRPARAVDWFMDVEMLMYNFAETYPKFKALEKLVHEFQRYIDNNQHMIVNYGKRYRAGLVISTAFVESLVNSLLGKRFTKKQQMQWSHRGAHLLLQTRTRVVNGELEATFRQWYPAMCANDAQPAILGHAA